MIFRVCLSCYEYSVAPGSGLDTRTAADVSKRGGSYTAEDDTPQSGRALVCLRQPYGDGRALFRLTFEENFAAVQFDNLFDDAHAEPSPRNTA